MLIMLSCHYFKVFVILFGMAIKAILWDTQNSSLIILGQYVVYDMYKQCVTYSPDRRNELKAHRILRLMVH